MNNSGSAKDSCFRLPALLATVLLCGAGVATAYAAGPVTRQIPSAGVTTVRSAAEGADGLQFPEFQPGLAKLNNADVPIPHASAVQPNVAGLAVPRRGGRFTNRSFARTKGFGEWVESFLLARAHPALALSFDGLNFRDNRLASGNNQFSVEPPDQGLCVGNGFVLETVNDVLRVFDTSGTALTAPIALNAFYGYPPAIDRTNFVFGPSITDPSCYFDQQTKRWFHIALTFDVDPPTGDLTGPNHLDLAVSSTSSPLGPWNIYRIPVQDDGTDGTPDHNCSGGMDKKGQPTGHGPCFGDYPHIGADAHGIYLTTNEFSLFGPEFKSAQIYAISKKALALGAVSIQLTQIDTIDHLLDGNPGFTVWPAASPAGEFETDNRGTEYLVSSLAVFNDSGTDNRLRLWALTNTKSLESGTPNLFLANNVLNVASYGVPPHSDQKDGNAPLRDCINDTALATPSGPGCWQFFFTKDKEPAHDEVLAQVDSNDSRIQQVVFADGKLYTALDTVVNVRGTEQAGAAFYIIKPDVVGGTVKGTLKKQGKVAVFGNNVNYPAIAALPNGNAVMAFTLVGADHYPSAAYVTVDESFGAGPIHVAAEGVGPEDGFTGYAAFGGGPNSRWGDYGAAVADGNSIWIASEYIGQTCTFAEYTASQFGSCKATRTSLGNWGTRISRVKP